MYPRIRQELSFYGKLRQQGGISAAFSDTGRCVGTGQTAVESQIPKEKSGEERSGTDGNAKGRLFCL